MIQRCRINWSFLQEDLIDEVSIVITPGADDSTDTQSLFEANEIYKSTDTNDIYN